MMQAIICLRMRRQRDERRREIAAAALELLAEGGPRQLTTRNLGARVDMDGSSLFRHFGNKGEILHAAIDLFEAALVETIPESAPSWESLRIFFLQRLALVQARPEVIQLAFNQHLLVVSGELDHAARVREIVARSVSFIRACLERAQSDGLISRTVLRRLLTALQEPPPVHFPEHGWEKPGRAPIRLCEKKSAKPP